MRDGLCHAVRMAVEFLTAALILPASMPGLLTCACAAMLWPASQALDDILYLAAGSSSLATPWASTHTLHITLDLARLMNAEVMATIAAAGQHGVALPVQLVSEVECSKSLPVRLAEALTARKARISTRLPGTPA